MSNNFFKKVEKYCSTILRVGFGHKNKEMTASKHPKMIYFPSVHIKNKFIDYEIDFILSPDYVHTLCIFLKWQKFVIVNVEYLENR